MNTALTEYEKILERLRRVGRYLLIVDLRSRALRSITLIVVVWFLAVLMEMLFLLPPTSRTVLFFLSVGISLVLTFVLPGRPLLGLLGLTHPHSDAALAKRIGMFFPEVRDRLVNLLHLHGELNSNESPYSHDLLRASLDDLIRLVGPLNFLDSVDTTPPKYHLKTLGLTVGAIAFAVLFFPGSFGDASVRLYSYSMVFDPPTRYTFTVYPGDREIVKGDDVTVSVAVRSGLVPEALPEMPVPELYWKAETEIDFSRSPFQRLSGDSFSATISGLRQSLAYHVRLDGEKSDSFRLTVLDRPMINSLQVRVRYPDYTGLPPRVQDEFAGDVVALPGSRIGLSGSSDKQLLLGRVEFQNGSGRPLIIDGMRFSADFVLKEEGAYHVELLDTDSLANANPISYRLSVVPDEYPVVDIIQPGQNVDITGAHYLSLRISIRDDFGFTRLRIGYRLSQSRYESISDVHQYVELPVSHTSGARQDIVPYSWDLRPLALVPEDVVEYFAEVYDNDHVNGPKSSRTPLYLLRLPSLQEVFADLDQGHEESLEQLRESLDRADELKKEIESLNEDIRQNKEVDWQQEKKLETLAEKYQDIQRELQNLESRLDTLVQHMQEQRVLSNETLEKYLELQELFDELNSAELQRALAKMQDAMQNVNRQQLQEALSQLQFSEEQFRSSLDRTMNLLKRIQVELKLDELRTRAEEVERMQSDITAETQSARPDSVDPRALAQRQEEVARKQEELEAVSRDLQQRMEEFFNEMPADRVERLNDSLSAYQLQDHMQNVAGQLQRQEYSTAIRTQQTIQESLGAISQEIQSIQQEMLQQQSQRVMAQLRKSSQDLLELSRRQEEIRNQTRASPGNSPQLRQSAQDQAAVMRDLGHVIDELSELSKKSFAITSDMGRAIGKALGHMQQSSRSLDIRNGTGAAQEQTSAMGSLNEASVLVQQAVQAMMQSGGGGMGGLMQQLQDLAGRQASVNMQTKSMRDAADAARLAAEQAAVQKSLEQLQQEAQQRGESDRILGDLDRIGDQMNEVVREMEQQNVSSETVRRQEQILSRLLDASRSMREQDFERRRRAQTGENVVRRGPDRLDPALLQRVDRLHQELLNALEWGYSRDYEALIRAYFEMLRQLDVRQE